MRTLALACAFAAAACAPQKLPPASAFEAQDAARADVAVDVQPDTAADAAKAVGTDAVVDVAGDSEVADAVALADLPADPGPTPDAADGSMDAADLDAADSADGASDTSADGATQTDAAQPTDAVAFVPMDATPCADPLALPDNCTLCTAGFVAVATATGSVCAADFPLWGPRPDAPLPGWFSDTGKGTVTDSHSGRMWAKEVSPVAITWPAANGYCAGLSAGGYSDWRLPTLAELLTIRDTTAPAPTVVTALTNTPKDFVWTASAVQGAAQESYWTVLFNGGSSAFSVATAKCHARCVR